MQQVNATADEMTQAEFAALRGVSAPMVTKWKAQGRLVLSPDGKRVCVAASIARLESTRDPARGGDRTAKPATAAQGGAGQPAGGQGAPAGLTATVVPAAALIYTDEAAREKRAKAQLAELELAKLAGELVAARAVDALMFGLARAGREAVLALPDRLATVLAAESDAAVVHAKLLAECRKVCAAMATPNAHAPTQAVAA